MRTTSFASVGRIRRSTTLASMTRLLPEDPNILTPEYQMDYISAIQHFSTLWPYGLRSSAIQHGGCAALSASQHSVLAALLAKPGGGLRSSISPASRGSRRK